MNATLVRTLDSDDNPAVEWWAGDETKLWQLNEGQEVSYLVTSFIAADEDFPGETAAFPTNEDGVPTFDGGPFIINNDEPAHESALRAAGVDGYVIQCGGTK